MAMSAGSSAAFTRRGRSSNIPLVWMLERAETVGLRLPPRWQARFPCDPTAPACGTWRGVGKAFLLRHRRRIGRDRSEHIHPSVAEGGSGALAGVLRRHLG